MKKFFKFIFVFVLVVYSVNLLFVFTKDNHKVYAEEPLLLDNTLTNVLAMIAGVENLEELSSTAFSTYTELDLSGRNISSLEGLDYFDLSNVKVLNLSKNNIAKLELKYFKGCSSLKELNISNNALTEFNLVGLENYTAINKLILNNNYITNANLSFLVNDGEINPYCNLQNNLISSLSNLTLPSSEYPTVVDLNNNLLIREGSFDRAPHTLNIYFQGIGNKSKINKATTLKVFGGSEYGNQFVAKLYNRETNEELTFVDVTKSLEKLYSGKYFIKFYNGTNLIYDLNSNDRDESLKTYALIEFDVMPNIPKIKYYLDGKEVNSLPTNTKGKVEIELESDIEDSPVFSVNGTDFEVATKITVESAGTYNIRIKSMYGDLSSEQVAFTIKIKKSLQVLKIIILTLAITLLVFLVCAGYFIMLAINKKRNKNKKAQ